ncbi:MAG: pyridoxamine 5'-phosphate oxidase family protein [Woeseiaceae bacterium]|nr:pyridoxamine 5'-phosphate oxidase family protein [Woeseiaceae bacterium]
MTDRYDVTARNKMRQLREKGAYDRDSVHGVLDAGLYASVAFVQDGQPVVVPMIYGRDGDTIYLHGARKARVIRLLEQTGQVCINVTLVDGLVLARSAFNSSMNYRSATVFGPARLIEDDAGKVKGMRVISEHLMPGRWDELREPLDKEIKMTGVIAVEIESASAKISTGMPDDEDEDYAIPVWAGVLPVESRSTSLLDDDRLLDGAEASAVVRALQNRKV